MLSWSVTFFLRAEFVTLDTLLFLPLSSHHQVIFLADKCTWRLSATLYLCHHHLHLEVSPTHLIFHSLPTQQVTESRLHHACKTLWPCFLFGWHVSPKAPPSCRGVLLLSWVFTSLLRLLSSCNLCFLVASNFC